MATQLSPLVVIVGQTASGKSAIALRLAAEVGGEIVAADSWTVRRQLDIGTAKPTLAQRQQVRHHMIDVVDVCADYTAAVYKKQALSAIADIAGRDKLPLLVGGTGLYIDAVLYDYSFLPPGDASLRQQLNDMTIEELLNLASEQQLDTSQIDVRNKRRIIRLIESGGAQPSHETLRANTLVIGVRVPRDELHQRVRQRVHDMMAGGLEQEVSGLIERYGWDCEGLKGIGYAEWRPYYDGEISREEVAECVVKNTLSLAKRQRTWFRRNQHIVWCDDYDTCERALYTFLENHRPDVA